MLDRIGDKWSVLVLFSLEDGERRFNELRRQITDISQRVLTETLRGLLAWANTTHGHVRQARSRYGRIAERNAG